MKLPSFFEITLSMSLKSQVEHCLTVPCREHNYRVALAFCNKAKNDENPISSIHFSIDADLGMK